MSYGRTYNQSEELTMKQYTDRQLKQMQVLMKLVNDENVRQVGKWGVQTHTLFEWVNYATEELGELAKAVSEYEYRDGACNQIFLEAIQTATLCLKIAEMVSIPPTTPSTG